MGVFTLLELTMGAKEDMNTIKKLFDTYMIEYFIILSGLDTMYAEISAGELFEKGRKLETIRNTV